MQIENKTKNTVAFQVHMPSGRRFRLAIEAGEIIAVAPSIQIGLADNAHFKDLVKRKILKVKKDVQNSRGDGSISGEREPEHSEGLEPVSGGGQD